MTSRAWLSGLRLSSLMVLIGALIAVAGPMSLAGAVDATTPAAGAAAPAEPALDSLGRPEVSNPALIGQPAAMTARERVAAVVDADVQLFNPDIYRLDADGTAHYPGRSLFVEPASDVARRVLDTTWFSSLVFLPFLILPQVLLFLIIYRFRDRGDGRKPATFLTNHRLEIIWTAIPCLAVIIVSIPTYYILEFMELPPSGSAEAEVISVTGKQFAWDYEYKRYYKDPQADEKECLKIGLDPINQVQEPLILVKGRPVVLNVTSQDVNHAWWVPAFGVKKTAIQGRLNFVWFTPDTLGVYKGQCAELCGANHGNMIITTVVVTPDEFARYIILQRYRDDAAKVWSALQSYQPPAAGSTTTPPQVTNPAAVAKQVQAYLAKDPSPARQYALSFWIAYNYASFQRAAPIKGSTLSSLLGIQTPAPAGDVLDRQIAQAIAKRRALVDDLLPALTRVVASMDADPALVASSISTATNPR